MKVGVNSRLFQGAEAGIHGYIRSLYSTLLKKDRVNSYIFFQTMKKKMLGKTKVSNQNFGIINPLIFDNFTVRDLAAKEKVQVLHGPANILPFLKLSGTKYVVTIHDLAFLRFPDFSGLAFSNYYRFVVGRSLTNADVVVADSIKTKEDIMKYYFVNETKIRVIYPGVDNIFFNFSKSMPKITGKYFFSLSTQFRRKNIYSVLIAMAKLEELDDYKYVVAGLISETEKRELGDRVRELGLSNRFLIYGYVSIEELINLYRHAAFFIYPSFYEGFGFPVLEAMACRCPVITSGNSSMREFFQDKGFLVDPFDINDIKQKLKDMVKLPSTTRAKIIDRNFLTAKQFTWEKTAGQMKDIFNELV